MFSNSIICLDSALPARLKDFEVKHWKIMVICVPPIIAGNMAGIEGNQKKWNQEEKSLPVAVIMLLMNQTFVTELLSIFGR